VATLAGSFYIYHQLTASPHYRVAMEAKMPWLMMAFHTATNDKYRVISSGEVETVSNSSTTIKKQ